MPVLILTAINLDDLENKIPDQDITGLVCSKKYFRKDEAGSCKEIKVGLQLSLRNHCKVMKNEILNK